MVKTADVYIKKEHGIDLSLIDPDAVKIVHRLQKAGHAAYVVGGAVRDLLLGRRPKDFDLVTDAEPNHIRKLFRNSRIIGKRFRLVHIFFKDDKIIEVSTFRSIEAGTFNNLFGTIEEDALRRDFSINALYYDPVEEKLIDYVGGFKDIRSRKLKPVIPLETIFVEDPVRMIRAVKYAVSSGCRMGFFLKQKIRKSASLLADVSPSRISEEAFKILQGGHSSRLFSDLQQFGLLPAIMPNVSLLLADRKDPAFGKRFHESLRTLDEAVNKHRESRRSIQLSYLVADYLFLKSPWASDKKHAFAEIYQGIKDFIKPVTPPNIEVERCLVYLLRKKRLYLKDGFLPSIDTSQRIEEDQGDFAKDIEALREKRDGRRRRPRSPAAHPGQDRKLPGLEQSHAVQLSPEGAPAKKRKRQRNRKKKNGPGNLGPETSAS